MSVLLAELSHRADRWGNLNGEIHQHTTTRIVFFHQKWPWLIDWVSNQRVLFVSLGEFYEFIWQKSDSPFQLAHNTSPKRIYFVQLLVSSHLQNSLKDCRRLTLEVACPRLPVRVLKRQNWAVSAPTVEKIGGAGGAKNAKHFKGYLTHMSQYIFQSIFLLIELKSLFEKCTKNGRHS